jgi:adenylosuccinate lyase
VNSERYDHDTYLSPFTWRYGSQEMRRIWSEEHKRRLWRRIWVALAEAQHEAGLVTAEQLADLRAHEGEVDVARAHRIEAEIRHDLMAEVRAFAEQCPVGGGIIHLGATSTDVEDNADALRLHESLILVEEKLTALLRAFAAQIEPVCASTPRSCSLTYRTWIDCWGTSRARGSKGPSALPLLTPICSRAVA